MSILINGMKMPKNGLYQIQDGKIHAYRGKGGKTEGYDLIEVPTPHGRLVDADKLHKATYHRAFETDGDTMWQSGCWVRYRAIEQVQDGMSTIIEAEEGEEA